MSVDDDELERLRTVNEKLIEALERAEIQITSMQ
jgi:hypothetical protein